MQAGVRRSEEGEEKRSEVKRERAQGKGRREKRRRKTSTCTLKEGFTEGFTFGTLHVEKGRSMQERH